MGSSPGWLDGYTPDTDEWNALWASKLDDPSTGPASYLPIGGGTLTGALVGTTGSFSGAISTSTLSSTGSATILSGSTNPIIISTNSISLTGPAATFAISSASTGPLALQASGSPTTIGGTLGVTGATTMTGRLTVPGVSSTASQVTAGISSAANTAFYVSGALSGSISSGNYAPFYLSYNDNVAAGASAAAHMMMLNWAVGGAGTYTGSRDVLYSAMNITNALTLPQTSLFQNITAFTHASANVGGTALTYTSSSGVLTGMNPIANLESGATNWLLVQGMEIDSGIATGASAVRHFGLNIVLPAAHAVPGTEDAALHFGGQVGFTRGWLNGIMFGGGSSNWSIDGAGTLINAARSTQPTLGPVPTADTGIDFSAVTFTTASIKMPGFTVSPTGIVTPAAFTVATLPTAASAGVGALAYVTDATTPTYRGTLTGGGAVKTLVMSDGAAWTSH